MRVIPIAACLVVLGSARAAAPLAPEADAPAAWTGPVGPAAVGPAPGERATADQAPGDSAAVLTRYDQAVQAADAGDPAQAAAALQAIVADYPQDYELALRLARLYLRLHQRDQARRLYQEAIARSSAPSEAQVELAELLAIDQRCGAALDLLRPVLHRGIDAALGAQARAAQQRCQAVYPVQAFATLAGGTQLFPSVASSVRPPSIALAARVDLRIVERVVLAVGYRARIAAPAFDDGSGQLLRGQHEVYADAGYHAPRAGLSLRYAYLGEQGGAAERAHHAGLSARLTTYGDALLDLTTSVYSDATFLRGAFSWVLPIAGGVYLTPALAGQYTGMANAPTPLLSGALTIALVRPRFSLWIGGKYGNELRPAYLDLGIINNLPEAIRYGGWVGFSVLLARPDRLGSRGLFSLRLGYAFDKLDPIGSGATTTTCTPRLSPPPPPGQPPMMDCTTTTTPASGVAGITHALTLGLTRSF